MDATAIVPLHAAAFQAMLQPPELKTFAPLHLVIAAGLSMDSQIPQSLRLTPISAHPGYRVLPLVSVPEIGCPCLTCFPSDCRSWRPNQSYVCVLSPISISIVPRLVLDGCSFPCPTSLRERHSFDQPSFLPAPPGTHNCTVYPSLMLLINAGYPSPNGGVVPLQASLRPAEDQPISGRRFHLVRILPFLI